MKDPVKASVLPDARTNFLGIFFANLRGHILAIEKRDDVTSEPAARTLWKFPLAKLPSMFLLNGRTRRECCRN